MAITSGHGETVGDKVDTPRVQICRCGEGGACCENSIGELLRGSSFGVSLKIQ